MLRHTRSADSISYTGRAALSSPDRGIARSGMTHECIRRLGRELEWKPPGRSLALAACRDVAFKQAVTYSPAATTRILRGLRYGQPDTGSQDLAHKILAHSLRALAAGNRCLVLLQLVFQAVLVVSTCESIDRYRGHPSRQNPSAGRRAR